MYKTTLSRSGQHGRRWAAEVRALYRGRRRAAVKVVMNSRWGGGEGEQGLKGIVAGSGGVSRSVGGKALLWG